MVIFDTSVTTIASETISKSSNYTSAKILAYIPALARISVPLFLKKHPKHQKNFKLAPSPNKRPLLMYFKEKSLLYTGLSAPFDPTKP